MADQSSGAAAAAAQPEPVPQPRALSEVAPAAHEMPRNQSLWPGVMLIVGLLLVWEIASRLHVVDPFFLPPVSQILQAGWASIASGEIPVALSVSLARLFTGYFIGAMLGVGLGFLVGYYPFAYRLFEPLIELLRPLPSAAIIPVAILFLGIGNGMKIFIIAWACFFPVLVNTVGGVRGVDPLLLDTGRTFMLKERELFRYVLVPAAAPQVVTGMRVSLAIAFILVVIAEMVAGNTGMGFVILNAQRSFEVPTMYAGIFVLAILGYSLNRLFLALEGRQLAWYTGMNRQRQ